MNIEDFSNREIIREISLDLDKLIDISKEDNGFLFKKMGDFSILPSKQYISLPVGSVKRRGLAAQWV